jgi:hypothetical protein
MVLDINAIADRIQRLTLIEASQLLNLLEKRLSGFTSTYPAPAPVHPRAVYLEKRPDITQVKAKIDDGTEMVLSQKQRRRGGLSQSTFFGELADGSFKITLRLDWNDVDANGDPMLDADIYRDGKTYNTKSKWHHTRKKLEDGEWVYNFEFGSIKLRFKVGITSQREQTAAARIVSAGEGARSALKNDDPHAAWAFGEKRIFCAACQAVTTQNFLVDHNNEILATCYCGRNLKFPLTETEEELDALLAAHHKANQGQVRGSS